MEVELVKPFVDATIHVLATIASTDAIPGDPYVKNDQRATGDVTAVIGLSGAAAGTISVSFSDRCILSIVSRMFGEKLEELNGEIGDAVGEISNMISGQARQRLEKMGRIIHGGVPSVIMGKNHTVSHFTRFPVIAVPFETQEGQFTIEVCLED